MVGRSKQTDYRLAVIFQVAIASAGKHIMGVLSWASVGDNFIFIAGGPQGTGSGWEEKMESAFVDLCREIEFGFPGKSWTL